MTYRALHEDKKLVFMNGDNMNVYGVVDGYKDAKPSAKRRAAHTAVGSLGGAALAGGATAAYGYHKYRRAAKTGASREELAKIKAKYAKHAAIAAGVGAGIGGGAGYHSAAQHAIKARRQKAYDILTKNDKAGNMPKSTMSVVYDTDSDTFTDSRRVRNGKAR